MVSKFDLAFWYVIRVFSWVVLVYFGSIVLIGAFYSIFIDQTDFIYSLIGIGVYLIKFVIAWLILSYSRKKLKQTKSL